jgi:hypothetical protein
LLIKFPKLNLVPADYSLPSRKRECGGMTGCFLLRQSVCLLTLLKCAFSEKLKSSLPLNKTKQRQ